MEEEILVSNNRKQATYRSIGLLVLMLMVIFIMGAIAFFEPKSEVKAPLIQEEEVVEEAYGGSVPTGFPPEVPFEAEAIIEGKRFNYPAYGAVLYSLAYFSSSTKEGKHNEYLNFMLEEGYELRQGAEGEESGLLYGTRTDDTLSVIIKENGDGTLVNLYYLYLP